MDCLVLVASECPSHWGSTLSCLCIYPYKVVVLVVEYLDWLSALFRRSERVWAIGIPLYWKLAPPLSQTLRLPYHFRLEQRSRVLYVQVCYISYKPVMYTLAELMPTL